MSEINFGFMEFSSDYKVFYGCSLKKFHQIIHSRGEKFSVNLWETEGVYFIRTWLKNKEKRKWKWKKKKNVPEGKQN